MSPGVDGIGPDDGPAPAASSGMKYIILGLLITPYIVYVMWCVFLLSVLPNPQGDYQELISVGSMSTLMFGTLIAFISAMFIKRIVSNEYATTQSKVIGGAKVLAAVAPGIILSIMVPITIPNEPGLVLTITDPVNVGEFVAPISITFNLEESVQILAVRGLKPVKYEWDFDGDGKMEEETFEPFASAVYEKKGVIIVRARMTLNDGSTRMIATRIIIPRAVFSVKPIKTIVDEPVIFSIAHLISKENPIREVRWDFNNDGEVNKVSDEPSARHTFLQTGDETIRAVIIFQNQTQVEMEHTITIHKPDPLPFEVSIMTEPEFLVSPPPFGVIFTIDTEEPHQEVQWDFGDGEVAKGDRVGHTFREIAEHRVTAEVRSLSDGMIARVHKVVSVVNVLSINDLRFEGTPTVLGRQLTAEIPVEVNITPLTTLPLISFFWEAPKATVVQSTETTLRATYRRPGTYLITLIATDAEGSVLRLPLTLKAKPPSSSVTFRMSPDNGVAPLLVRFDASETVIPGDEITGFEWVFGSKDRKGGLSSPLQGGAQVEYLFDKPGTYQVKATAFTVTGDKISATKTIVIRAPVLDACFSTSRTSGKAPLGVSFDMSCSTGNSTTIKWDFGDGAESDEPNPIHVFERSGVYNVRLQLQDTAGSVSQEVLIITAEN